MTEHDKRMEAVNDDLYRHKLNKLVDIDGEKPVTFFPSQFLRLAIEGQGVAYSYFSEKVLGEQENYLKKFFCDHKGPLPLKIVNLLTDLSCEAPFNNKLFWMQSEFKVSDFIADVPQLDLTRFTHRPHTNWLQTVSTGNAFDNVTYRVR